MRGTGLAALEVDSANGQWGQVLASPIGPVRMDDDALIVRIQQGDRAALETLYRRYFDDLRAYARSIVRDDAVALEVCHDVFAAVMQKAGQFDPAGETPLRGWLFTITRNLSIDVLRARGRDLCEPWNPAELMELDRGDAPGHHSHWQRVVVEHDLPALSWISDKDLAFLIARLSAPQREALTLRHRFGLDTNEIAGIMGCTPRAVNDLEFRARRFLVERLQNLGRDAASFRREWQRMRCRRDPVLRERRYALTASAGARALLAPGGILGRGR